MSALSESELLGLEAEEPERYTEAEWERSDAILVELATAEAAEQRISGQCSRCDVRCHDLIGYLNEGLCSDCAAMIGGVD